MIHHPEWLKIQTDEKIIDLWDRAIKSNYEVWEQYNSFDYWSDEEYEDLRAQMDADAAAASELESELHRRGFSYNRRDMEWYK